MQILLKYNVMGTASQPSAIPDSVQPERKDQAGPSPLCGTNTRPFSGDKTADLILQLIRLREMATLPYADIVTQDQLHCPNDFFIIRHVTYKTYQISDITAFRKNGYK